MSFSLYLPARALQVAEELERAMDAPGEDLATAALAICRVEYPSLDAPSYVRQLDRLGEQAALRLRRCGSDVHECVRTLNGYLFDEESFRGNREQYNDSRNSFLNEVLDRRTGIPLSLAIIYLEVSRRAGLRVEGVNFPGHFLLRIPAAESSAFIIDPFHAGALLSERDCRELLRQHVGDGAVFDRMLLEPATRHHIVVRMLVNLKRLYVRMRSFPQARFVSDLLLAINPSAMSELRDRGLLAYHLEDFNAALRDLEAYLRLLPRRPPSMASVERPAAADGGHSDLQDDESDSDAVQIWEHVKTLRKRVAGFN